MDTKYLKDYTPKELSAKLNVHHTEVYHYIESGALKATNIGRGKKRARWIIKQTDAEEFIEGFQKGKRAKKIPAYVLDKHKKTYVKKVREKRSKLLDPIITEFEEIEEQLLELTIRMEELKKLLKEKKGES